MTEKPDELAQHVLDHLHAHPDKGFSVEELYGVATADLVRVLDAFVRDGLVQTGTVRGVAYYASADTDLVAEDSP